MEPRFNTRNKFVIALTSISLVALVLILILNYHSPTEKIFGADNFYSPAEQTVVNQKEVYQSLHKTLKQGDAYCTTTISMAQNPGVAGAYTWIVDGVSVTREDLAAWYVGGDSTKLAPYADGDSIVSPTTLKFQNANVSQYSTEYISITANIGTGYRIEWEDVACWWCHIDKENPTRHTSIVGAGGLYETCITGCVIGEATSDTVVSLYKQNSDGEWEPYSFEAFFFGTE